MSSLMETDSHPMPESRHAAVVRHEGQLGSPVLVVSSEEYFYDGWNLVHRIHRHYYESTVLHLKYIWGLDLSGTPQGAGGVGGQLMGADDAVNVFFAYGDTNGNVMGRVAAETGTVTASYVYDAFGNRIRGGQDWLNPFGFSTKLHDRGSGLIYYGYRFYSPTTGRWLNRDPIGELGGANLYAFVGNDPVKHWDYLGLHIEIDERLRGSKARNTRTGQIASRADLIRQINNLSESTAPNAARMLRVLTGIQTGLIAADMAWQNWIAGTVIENFDSGIIKPGEITRHCITEGIALHDSGSFKIQTRFAQVSSSTLGKALSLSPGTVHLNAETHVRMDCGRGEFSFFSIPVLDIHVSDESLNIDIHERHYDHGSASKATQSGSITRSLAHEVLRACCRCPNLRI